MPPYLRNFPDTRWHNTGNFQFQPECLQAFLATAEKHLQTFSLIC